MSPCRLRMKTGSNRALILTDWGRLKEAMALHKEEEALCLELGNKHSLWRSYGNQASILIVWGRLEEAMALLEKQKALCLELGNRSGLATLFGPGCRLARSPSREVIEASGAPLGPASGGGVKPVFQELNLRPPDFSPNAAF
jgi:hypothetical protein